MSYSVDTSALIEAWVRLYPRDVFPSIWGQIEQLIHNGKLLATEEVQRELKKKEDGLYDWASQQRGFFVPLNIALQQLAIQIINQFPSLTNTNTVMSGAADPFVIALAQDRNLTVVTAEKSKPTNKRIPDVCKDLNIPCITLLELFRQERWRL